VLIALAVVGVWLGRRADARATVTSMALLIGVGFILSLGLMVFGRSTQRSIASSSDSRRSALRRVSPCWSRLVSARLRRSGGVN
jgi:hypothetical protein